MIVKFIIPVINTESGDYSYNGREMSDEQYFEMIEQHAWDTRGMMNNLINNIRNQRNVYDNRRIDDDGLLPDIEIKNDEYKFDYCESEALIQTSNSEELDITGLDNFVSKGKKFLININVNPNSLEPDAESELRRWMDESKNVLNDETLDNKTKLLALPLREFIIDTSDSKNKTNPLYQLEGCKILKVYEEKYPFYFSLMVEKIEKEK